MNSRELRRLAAESHNREFEHKQNLLRERARIQTASRRCEGIPANPVAVAILLAGKTLAEYPSVIDRPRGKYAPAGFRK